MAEPITLIVSDAHLGAVPEENERAFRAFLARVPAVSDDLLIAGDLFDFWFEYRSVILRRHFATLRRLAEVVEAGVRVRLLGGNHDAWGGSFLREEVGIELLQGEVITEIRGRRALLAHGDGLGGGDWGYRLLKRVARSRAGAAVFRLVHPDLGARTVRWISGTPSRHAAEPAAEEAKAERLSRHAAGPAAEEAKAERLSHHAAWRLREDPSLDLVVFGHSHRPELWEVEPGRYYLNAGDWIHHFSYGVVGTERIELRRWNRGSPAPGGGSAPP